MRVFLGQCLEAAYDSLDSRALGLEQRLQRRCERMPGVQPHLVLHASSDALDDSRLRQPTDRQLNRAQVLTRPPREFANRHGFPGLLQHSQHPHVTLRAEDGVPRCSQAAGLRFPGAHAWCSHRATNALVV
jgi:hypothetical protein